MTKAKFQPFRELAYLILCDTCHDHQSELAIAIQCVDVVILEQDAHIVLQQLLRVLDAVQRIAGEARYLLRDDEVKHSPLGVCDHPQEAVPLVGTCAGNALVYVSGDVRPVGIFLNKLCVVLNLVFQTALLLHLLGRNAGIEGHAQRQVIN